MPAIPPHTNSARLLQKFAKLLDSLVSLKRFHKRINLSNNTHC